MKIKLDSGAYVPLRAHKTDAGLDLMSRKTETIEPYGSAVFDTGVHIRLPKNTAGLLISKSGLNVKSGITSRGLIDEGYQGPIIVRLYNHTNKPYTVKAGDKITQLVVFPVLYEDVELVDDFEEITERGDNGLGSSGK